MTAWNLHDPTSGKPMDTTLSSLVVFCKLSFVVEIPSFEWRAFRVYCYESKPTRGGTENGTSIQCSLSFSYTFFLLTD